jgi:hypothetical protein
MTNAETMSGGAPPTELDAVKTWLRKVEIGDGMHHKNLTVFPLFPSGSFKPQALSNEEMAKGTLPLFPEESERYVLIDDAIEAGEAVVEEITEGGQVPLLGVTNSAVKPILIPEGQILIGAKQNRTVNLTVLVAAGKQFQLPVACVEQGRWSYRTRQFRPDAYSRPSLREKKIKSAQMNRMMGHGAHSDQGEVWDQVNYHLNELDAPSPTRDMVDGYRAVEHRVKDYRDEIELPKRACGLLAVSRGRVVGLDLFDAPTTMQKLWKRLGEAYFVEVLADDIETPKADKALAEAFVATVADRMIPAAEQPELGFELELAGDDLAGTALWHDGAICHLAAFTTANPA